jgi:hypothetical protein
MTMYQNAPEAWGNLHRTVGKEHRDSAYPHEERLIRNGYHAVPQLTLVHLTRRVVVPHDQDLGLAWDARYDLLSATLSTPGDIPQMNQNVVFLYTFCKTCPHPLFVIEGASTVFLYPLMPEVVIRC